jgi:gamma-glutamyltranspeptidase/glutathione hydrolase
VDIQSLLTRALQPLADSIDDGRPPLGGGKGPGDTVWMGVMDNSGLAVSFIQSLYHEFGSGVVLPDTGIVWQNRGAAFSLDPRICWRWRRQTAVHTLNPAAARLNDGRVMVYGSMGGDGQPQTQAAIFTRYILQGVPLQESISRPRWLLGRTWGQTSDSLKLEGRFPPMHRPPAGAGSRRGGAGRFSEAMGHAGAIVRHPNGLFEGAPIRAATAPPPVIRREHDAQQTTGALIWRKWNTCWRWNWMTPAAASFSCSSPALPPWLSR